MCVSGCCHMSIFLKKPPYSSSTQPIKEEAYLKDLYSQYICTQEVNVYHRFRFMGTGGKYNYSIIALQPIHMAARQPCRKVTPLTQKYLHFQKSH